MAKLEFKSIARFMRSYNPEDTVTDYQPTRNECKQAFNRLNEVLFNNQLPPIKLIRRRLHTSWGIFNGKEKTGKFHITVRHRFPNPQLFIGTLAHEMIHYWQWINFGDKGVTHGKTFWQWKKKFAQHNIPLQERGGEDMSWYASRNFDLFAIYQKTID